MNLNSYLDKGYTYTDYLKKTETQLHDLESNDSENELIEHYKLNFKRIERIHKTFHVSEQQKELLQKVSSDFKMLIISEGWCGDGAQEVPVVNEIMKTMGVEVKIVFRDENLELIDAYLTNGGRSIPIFIGINADGSERFRFGPRPQHGNELLAKFKANPEVYTKEDFHKDLHLWYAKDKGNAIFNEIYELMK